MIGTGVEVENLVFRAASGAPCSGHVMGGVLVLQGTFCKHSNSWFSVGFQRAMDSFSFFLPGLGKDDGYSGMHTYISVFYWLGVNIWVHTF